jgi:plasmid stabilization system protein ParE
VTLKVVFRRGARREFDEAARWYEAQRIGLGARFVSEIDHVVALAAESPQRFPIVHGNIQCVHARRFPYSVFFRVEAELIVVLAVFHVHRDPAIWQQRAQHL